MSNYNTLKRLLTELSSDPPKRDGDDGGGFEPFRRRRSQQINHWSQIEQLDWRGNHYHDQELFDAVDDYIQYRAKTFMDACRALEEMSLHGMGEHDKCSPADLMQYIEDSDIDKSELKFKLPTDEEMRKFYYSETTPEPEPSDEAIRLALMNLDLAIEEREAEGGSVAEDDIGALTMIKARIQDRNWKGVRALYSHLDTAIRDMCIVARTKKQAELLQSVYSLRWFDDYYAKLSDGE